MLFVLLECYYIENRYDAERQLCERNLLFDLARMYGSRSEQWISTGRGAMRRRRLCAPPAIKTLKVTSILLDHDFKSHIPSAYLNENPDCAVLS